MFTQHESSTSSNCRYGTYLIGQIFNLILLKRIIIIQKSIKDGTGMRLLLAHVASTY